MRDFEFTEGLSFNQKDTSRSKKTYGLFCSLGSDFAKGQ